MLFLRAIYCFHEFRFKLSKLNPKHIQNGKDRTAKIFNSSKIRNLSSYLDLEIQLYLTLQINYGNTQLYRSILSILKTRCDLLISNVKRAWYQLQCLIQLQQWRHVKQTCKADKTNNLVLKERYL